MITTPSPNDAWGDSIAKSFDASVAGDTIGQNGGAEPAYLDPFDLASEAAWSELIRDVIALANSGGGRLIVRCAEAGDTIRETRPEMTADTILRRLAELTDSAFDRVHVGESADSATRSLEIHVGAAEFPIAFPAGSFYFRHGQRSEPATTGDLQAFFMRLLARVRRRWWRGIRRVLAAPIDSVVAIGAKPKAGKPSKISTANLQPVRIVTDPNAPAFQPQDVDRLYPWRQKDLVRELNSRLGRRALNSYDIQAVRRQHRLDERPDFVFNLPGAGRRYSPAVADWIMDQFAAAPEFFQQARTADHQMLRLRRQKPK